MLLFTDGDVGYYGVQCPSFVSPLACNYHIITSKGLETVLHGSLPPTYIPKEQFNIVTL